MTNPRDKAEFAEKAEAFLSDLRRISLKHGVVVCGCGCCGSPFLSGLGSKSKQKKMKGRYAISADFDRLEWE